MDIFNQRKKDIFSKQDKSSKGEVDKKISSLCNKINEKDNYYTTSSCAGRVVLIVDKNKKEKRVFRFVSHELINFEELKKELISLIQPATSPTTTPDLSRSQSSRGLKNIVNNKTKNDLNGISDKIKKSAIKLSNLNIKFKQEPCIIHVACRTLKDAQKFLILAQRAGWKRSGIIASGTNGRFIVEAISTEKLEFPIIINEKIIVDDNFLKIIVEKANENLKKSWKKIESLEKSIK